MDTVGHETQNTKNGIKSCLLFNSIISLIIRISICLVYYTMTADRSFTLLDLLQELSKFEKHYYLGVSVRLSTLTRVAVSSTQHC